MHPAASQCLNFASDCLNELQSLLVTRTSNLSLTCVTPGAAPGPPTISRRAQPSRSQTAAIWPDMDRSDSAQSASAQSDSAEYCHDLAQDGGLVAQDRRVGRVVRDQPDVPVALLEGLHRGLAVQHGRHDLAVLGHLLLADYDPVPVGNGRVDHRVTRDLEQEQGAVTNELPGEREHVLNRLLGQDRATCGDPT